MKSVISALLLIVIAGAGCGQADEPPVTSDDPAVIAASEDAEKKIAAAMKLAQSGKTQEAQKLLDEIDGRTLTRPVLIKLSDARARLDWVDAGR